MSQPRIEITVQPHDSLQPLFCGEVVAEGVDMALVRGNMSEALANPNTLATEGSFARHTRRVSEGDDSWVGIPAFVRRGFAHRFWYVLRASGYSSFDALAGKRIGTNEWAATGNTWARAAARERGVSIEEMSWTVGPVDGGEVSQHDRLPDHARYAEPNKPLRQMLLDGELDALEIPDPPGGFYERDSPFVRLFPDYRMVERAYYQRVRVFPGLHIIVMRRALFESDPWIARSIYNAMLESRRRWEQLRLEESDTSPWLQADLEETIELMGSGWQEYGVDANRHMMEVFCSEMKEQGHASRLVHAEELFKDFEAVPA